MRFTDRAAAGARLGARLTAEHGPDVVVLGLPRGGVPVARAVADALGAALDVLVVRKLGVPWHPEVAFGAIGEDGARVLLDPTLVAAGLNPEDVAEVEARERHTLERQVATFRGGRPPVPLAGRTVVVVDDGLATGATAAVACDVARARGAARVVVAVPVASTEAVERLRGRVDAVVALSVPARFRAVGEAYRDFTPTPDDEVVACLAVGA